MNSSLTYSGKVSLFLLLAFGLLLQSGCEPAFTPIKTNDNYYSIFGYLNASADTQFVRIEKLRDSLFTGTPTHLNATVTLTNKSTGQSAVMKDSLFHYSNGKAHNYYTDLDINPDQTYRLEVRSGDQVSSAKVRIPSSFPEPILMSGSSSNIELEIHDIDRLVAVKTVYYTYLNCQDSSPFDPNSNPCPDEPTINRDAFSHLQDTVHTGDGTIEARIKQRDDLREVEKEYPEGRTFTLVKVNVIVAAGNPDWPDFLTLDEESVAHPGIASNVEGGTGLLGGIVSDTVEVYSMH